MHAPRPLLRARRWPALAALLAAGALSATAATAARAQEAPAVRFAPGSPAMVLAEQLAVAHWGVDPCGGAIKITWVEAAPAINAIARWSNPTSPFDSPATNTGCSIDVNPLQNFTWPKFCTVIVHEYGHLAGHQHTVDGPDVMSPMYRVAIPECVAAAEPGVAAAAAPSTSAVAAPAKSAPSTTRAGRPARPSTAGRGA
jgi:hypothetical protein